MLLNADLILSDDYNCEGGAGVVRGPPETPLVLEISKEGQITLNPDVYPEIVERSGGGSHVTVLEDRLELLAKAMSGEPLVQLLVAHQVDYQRFIDVPNCLA